MRRWIRGKCSYIPPVQIGEAMRAFGLGNVLETGAESVFTEGDLVSGSLGMGGVAIAIMEYSNSKVSPAKSCD